MIPQMDERNRFLTERRIRVRNRILQPYAALISELREVGFGYADIRDWLAEKENVSVTRHAVEQHCKRAAARRAEAGEARSAENTPRDDLPRPWNRSAEDHSREGETDAPRPREGA
jgi:hypothetical protein